ncbi:MAG TPA: hypothetical protein VM123_18565 [archaeon]|nr:hypothetical protein [archaeon]
MKTVFCKIIFFFIIISANSLPAQVYTPRVTTDQLPDYTEIGRFVSWQKWRDLPPREKAVAIWRFITDYETGLYPIQGIYEDPNPGPEFPFFDERDLVKVLNVHGHGYCGLLSPTLDGIYAHAGFPDSRIHNMDANHHCVTEVFYQGGWHYFDVDLRGMLYKPDSTVASIRDAMTDRSLWTAPQIKVEPFYPLDDKARMYESFAACKLTPMYHWYKNGHTMDFVLRPGESMTRYWQPQGGRWHHPWLNPGGFDMAFLKRKFEQPPRGLKCKHDGWSKWTHGNVFYSYSPRLTNAYEDFERGVYDYRGVRPTSNGVETAPDSTGYVIFEVRTPYIIVGRVHELDRPEKIDDAATLHYRSLGPVEVSVSTDNAHTWHRIGGVDSGKAESIDFTRKVLGTYGYLVRFDLAEASGLAEITLNTWGQVAPVSLPRLFAGTNRMRFSTGDRYGCPTTVREVRLNLRNPAELERYAVRMNADYQPLCHTARLKGEVVLKIDSKPGTKIKWFTAGGYFHTFTGRETSKTGNAIYYSTAGPEGPWKEAARSKVPTWALSWHYGMDQDVVLDDPAETVFLKYIGDPAVNQIWVYAHCLGRTRSETPAVRVTHGFEVDGKYSEARNIGQEGKENVIVCDSEPENLFIRFELPSEKRDEPFD